MTLPIEKIGIALAAFHPDVGHFYEQLRSIQEQTFQNWICFITFDSPLEEIQSLNSFKIFFNDPRFRWIENPQRLGHKKNFEKAIALCVGEKVDAIACSDQDDIWLPGKLERCRQKLSELGPWCMVHSDMLLLLNDGRTSSPPDTAWKLEQRNTHLARFEHLLVRNICAGASMLFDAQIAKAFPLIPESVLFHDHWIALIASLRGKVVGIDEPLFQYRQHTRNVVGITRFQGFFSMHTLREKNLKAIVQKLLLQWEELKSRSLFFLELAKHPLLESFLPLIRQATQPVLRPDLGWGLLIRSFKTFQQEQPLSRALFARALGKGISFFLPKRTLSFLRSSNS